MIKGGGDGDAGGEVEDGADGGVHVEEVGEDGAAYGFVGEEVTEAGPEVVEPGCAAVGGLQGGGGGLPPAVVVAD